VSTAAGVFGALAASVCYGTAAVLQDVGARRTHRTGAVDPRLLLRLTGSMPYMSGLGLDLLGFLLALTAMRRLPVFAVEALIAPYGAVTAVLAAWLLKAPLRARGWLALSGVAAGVAMLAFSAQPQPIRPVGILARSSLLATTIALGAVAACIDRVAARAAAVLALIGGLVWGLIPLATRMLRDPGSIHGLLSDPAAYTVAAAGALGLLLYTAALQRTGVVTATVMAILGETLLPAATGVLVLGDRPRPCTGVVAVIGFFLTVGGGLVLARCRDVEPTDTTTKP
jgi:drug/metabolite transporter (DMT)-like permease